MKIIQRLFEDVRRRRRYNTMIKRKHDIRTNSDLQNIAKETKDSPTQTPLTRGGGIKSGVLEVPALHTPLVSLVCNCNVG